jgi:hypothetical protein
MYNTYIMRRTQIYLTDGQGRLLERRSKAAVRVSALIRSAVDETYTRRRDEQRENCGSLAMAGSWTRFPETGAAFVERIRGCAASHDCATRLMRLVLDTSVLIDHLHDRPAAATTLIPDAIERGTNFAAPTSSVPSCWRACGPGKRRRRAI